MPSNLSGVGLGIPTVDEVDVPEVPVVDPTTADEIPAPVTEDTTQFGTDPGAGSTEQTDAPVTVPVVEEDPTQPVDLQDQVAALAILIEDLQKQITEMQTDEVWLKTDNLLTSFGERVTRLEDKVFSKKVLASFRK